MSKSDSYILGVGERAAQRLEIQSKLYEASTLDLLKRAGLKKNMKVLEVACGAGSMTNLIAKVIGDEGQLIATDISPEQLEIASSKTSSRHVQFVESDILKANPAWPNRFDLICSRYILGHLREPKKGLAHMISYLKPGGAIVCEETNSSSSFCSPHSDAFERLFALVTKCKALSGATSQGDFIYHDFVELGLLGIEANLFQPLLKSRSEKRLLVMALEEVTPHILKNGLASEDEIKRLHSEVEALCLTDAFIGYLRNTQIFGYNR